jgi:hypothetical protein
MDAIVIGQLQLLLPLLFPLQAPFLRLFFLWATVRRTSWVTAERGGHDDLFNRT